MISLRELQAGLRAALLDGAPAIAGEIVGGGLDPEARVDLYPHHVLTSHTGVLRDAFPVVCRLVDERFFAYAANAFVRRHPPAGPCLFEYGAAFPGFLADFPPCRPLAYLADVARLEWALAEAAHADDAPALAPGDLSAVAAEDTPRLRLRLHPALVLVESPWPVDLIWRANQPGADPSGAVDLGAGGARLEVSRRGDDPVFRRLPPGVFALRRALRRGDDLEQAVGAALDADGALDLGAAIREMLADGAVVGYTLDPVTSTSTMKETT